MWCLDCRQDVPAVASTELGRFHCPRCKETVCDRVAVVLRHDRAHFKLPKYSAAARDSLKALPRSAGISATLPKKLDLWEVDEQLRHAARILGLTDPVPDAPVIRRLDSAHQGVAKRHRHRTRRRQIAGNPPSPGIFCGATGVLIWLGTAALACGGVLVGWAKYSGRLPLENIGLEILAAAMASLCIGVLLQIASVAPPSRSAVASRHRPHGGPPRMHQDKSYSRRQVGRHAGKMG